MEILKRFIKQGFFEGFSHRPFMEPGKRSFLAFWKWLSLIQLPSWLFTPAAGMGMVSLCCRVTITVLLSTRATSLGSVRANQLHTISTIRAFLVQIFCRLVQYRAKVLDGQNKCLRLFIWVGSAVLLRKKETLELVKINKNYYIFFLFSEKIIKY